MSFFIDPKIQDFLADVERVANHRINICKNAPACPKCRTRQVQIINAVERKIPHWKCRECKHTFLYWPIVKKEKE